MENSGADDCRSNDDRALASRRDVLLGASALASLPLLGLSGAQAADAGAPYDPSMSLNLSSEELAKYRNPQLLKHLFSAKPLVNRERANDIMDRHGLDALVACTPKNVYYLSSHDNAFYHTGIEHMLFAVLPRREDAPPALIIWGALLYHLDYRPTWMSSVEIFTAPLSVERLAGGMLRPEQMRGDPPAMRYNRNLVREGAQFSDRDLFQLALAAEFADKPAASALHALKRTLLAAGVSKGKVGFDDPRVIPWMADVGLDRPQGRRRVRHLQGSADGEVRERSRAATCGVAALRVRTRCRDRLLHVGQQISDVEVEYRQRMGALGGNTRWLIINQDGLNSGRIERDKVIKIDSVGDYLGYVGDIGRSIVVGNPPTRPRGATRPTPRRCRWPTARFGQACRSTRCRRSPPMSCGRKATTGLRERTTSGSTTRISRRRSSILGGRFR